MSYTIGEMARRLGVAPSTLRYYEKEGLLPFVERTEGGIRRFQDKDYAWLQIIECLKASGLSIKDIRAFIHMALEGDSTIGDRLELFRRQRERILAEMASLQQTLETVEYKCWYYEQALADGSTARLDQMPADALPERFRGVKQRIDGTK